MGVPGFPNIPWPWQNTKKDDYVPVPAKQPPLIPVGPNGLPIMPGGQPSPAPHARGNGPRNAAQAYLEQLMKRNEEGIRNSRVGTTSRSYANAHGAQKDMLPTDEIQRRYDAANGITPGSSSNGVGSGGSGGMGASAEVDPMSLLPTRTDLGALYDQLVKKLTGYGDDINRDFSASEKAIREQYDRSNVGLTGNFSNANKNLELAKAGLGYGDTSSYQQNMNNITENADLSETADLSYLEKMKSARGIEMKDILTKVQSDRIAQQNAQDLALQEAMLQLIATRSGGGSGGGGGGRGRGGGSSSGDISGSTTSTQTDTIDDPQAQEQYEYLARTYGQDVAEQFRDNYDLTMGNDNTKNFVNQINRAANRLTPVEKASKVAPRKTGISWADRPINNIIGTAKKATAAQKAAIAKLEILRRASYGSGSGITNNPRTTVVNKSTAKEKT